LPAGTARGRRCGVSDDATLILPAPPRAIVRVARRASWRRFGDFVRVGESGLVAGHGAHADALVDREAAGLDDAFFQAPAFAAVNWKYRSA
jgi:hypothetical protein